ncbi:MAG: twin transmembrane helix small protein [Alphaproteobacteria bacterium]|nr:twin transmembrane helix small protein [Alphaproteobacteria bacterium]
MSGLIDWAAPLAVAAVAVVLALGLINMLRGGSASMSQTLMRWRVILQFVAIVIVMAVIYLKSS